MLRILLYTFLVHGQSENMFQCVFVLSVIKCYSWHLQIVFPESHINMTIQLIVCMCYPTYHSAAKSLYCYYFCVCISRRLSYVLCLIPNKSVDTDQLRYLCEPVN